MNQLLQFIFFKPLCSTRNYLLAALLLITNLALAQNGNNAVVTITSSPTSACKGQPVTFTATVVNGGALPVYQWLINGNTAGGNSNRLTSTALADGDVVKCLVTTASAGAVNSNMLTITILSPPAIVQHDLIVCPGSSVRLDADVSTGAYSKYKTVDFSNQFNFNVSTNPYGTAMAGCPTGNVSFNGVPFYIFPWSDVNNGWNAYYAAGNDPRMLDMPVNEDGVVAINLLANTYYGLRGPSSYVSVDFWANGQVVFTKNLVGNDDIRDYNNGGFADNINNNTTVNAWQSASGQNRLDNVHIAMPFTTRIDRIVVNDHGGNGQRLFIMAATVEKQPLQLLWSTGETTPSITVSPTQATTYSIIATNNVASCSANVTINMTTPVVPSVSITASGDNVCSGTPLMFTATPVNGGSAPVYQWLVNGVNAGTNSSQFTANTFANGDAVTCRITSNAPCVTTPTATSAPLNIAILPSPAVDAGPSTTIHYGDYTQLKASVTGNVASIQWSPAQGLDNPTALQPIANPLVTTTYTLFAQGQNTCTAMATVTIKVLPVNLFIPNTFTPNNDGVNDVWNIRYLNEFNNCTVAVFNRYGKQLFRSVGYSRPWDGTYNSKILPAGTYYYVIDLKDGTARRSGYVTVLY